MYFGYQQTLDWTRRVAEIARRHRRVDLFVLPSFPVLAPVLAELADTSVGTGAQDLFWEPSGAFTGEVSGLLLAEMGCRYVEVGHAERRRIFGETDAVVTAKTRAALDAGLVPVVCVGETERMSPSAAAAFCVAQLERSLPAGARGPIVVAYEPVWAIGAARPASVDHIREVCVVLGGRLGATDRLIYGGSAGPGLLTALGDRVDGLFLGRFAHDPTALESVLDEAGRRSEATVGPSDARP